MGKERERFLEDSMVESQYVVCYNLKIEIQNALAVSSESAKGL